MGSSGASTTNKMLGEETKRAQDIGDTAGSRSEEIYKAGRGDTDFARTGFHSMYDSLLGGGYGGSGGVSLPGFDSSSLPFYMNLMNNGGYSEADRSNILSYATGPISGLFEGLKRSLETTARGGGAGYGAGLSKLAREQSYGTSEAAKGVAADLADRILASKLQGAAGVTDIESAKRAYEAQRASASRSGQEEYYNRQRQLLYDILGIEGNKDLSYMDRQLGAEGLATGSITGRADETPSWMKMTSSLLPSAVNAAVGAFSGGGHGKGDSSISPNYYDPYYEDNYDSAP